MAYDKTKAVYGCTDSQSEVIRLVQDTGGTPKEVRDMIKDCRNKNDKAK